VSQSYETPNKVLPTPVLGADTQFAQITPTPGVASSSYTAVNSSSNQSLVESVYNGFDSMEVSVPVSTTDGWFGTTKVKVKAQYRRIGQNSGETAPDFEAKPANELPAPTEAVRVSSRGKASASDLRTALQAAVDEGRVGPFEGPPAWRVGDSLTDDAKEQIVSKLRDYQVRTIGVDCSGFAYQVVSAIREKNGLAREWGDGLHNTNTADMYALPEIEPALASAGDLIVTSQSGQVGHVRVVRTIQPASEVETDALQLNEALWRNLGMGPSTTLYAVTTLESASGVGVTTGSMYIVARSAGSPTVHKAGTGAAVSSTRLVRPPMEAPTGPTVAV
jgi:hypothetical protein